MNLINRSLFDRLSVGKFTRPLLGILSVMIFSLAQSAQLPQTHPELTAENSKASTITDSDDEVILSEDANTETIVVKAPEVEPEVDKKVTSENDYEVNEDEQQVKIVEPFIEIYTGPGRGFPIFYIVEEDEFLWVIKRKNNWFKVRTKKHKVGWVPLSELQNAQNLDGSTVAFKELGEKDFSKRKFELGFRTGDFEGSNYLGVSGAWQFTENLAVEMVLGQGLGEFSETQQMTLNLTNTPFPEWSYTPYFGVGAGKVHTKPSAILVKETDRKDEVVFVTFGLKAYITDRFLFRSEYRSYVVLTTEETNETLEEWTIGFSVFF